MATSSAKPLGAGSTRSKETTETRKNVNIYDDDDEKHQFELENIVQDHPSGTSCPVKASDARADQSCCVGQERNYNPLGTSSAAEITSDEESESEFMDGTGETESVPTTNLSFSRNPRLSVNEKYREFQEYLEKHGVAEELAAGVQKVLDLHPRPDNAILSFRNFLSPTSQPPPTVQSIQQMHEQVLQMKREVRILEEMKDELEAKVKAERERRRGKATELDSGGGNVFPNFLPAAASTDPASRNGRKKNKKEK